MYSISTFERFPALNIDCIGFSSNPSVTRFGPATRFEHVVIYVLEGSGFFNNIRLTKGQGFIHSILSLGEYYPDPDDEWTLLWIVSDEFAFTHLDKYYKADKKTHIFNYDFADKLVPVTDFIRENTTKRFNRAKMLELYMGILSHHMPMEQHFKYESNERKYAETAENHIKTYYNLNLKVSDLTKLLGIGQPYLFTIFKKFFGVSPKQYIIEFRLKQAKKLLTETSMQINIIANSVGYKDSHDFTKLFTRKFGLSPSEYRKNNQKDQKTEENQ